MMGLKSTFISSHLTSFYSIADKYSTHLEKLALPRFLLIPKRLDKARTGEPLVEDSQATPL
jgi:hypothetical protein